MPRTAWLRRIVEVQNEVWDWRCVYAHEASQTHSPALELKLRERQYRLDHVWHEIEKALEPLRADWR